MKMYLKSDLNLSKPVKTNHFLWHLSSKRNRKSILENGILTPHQRGYLNNSNLIFANNFNEDLQSMWPLPIEAMYINFECEFKNNKALKSAIIASIANCFDFWRIDTKKLKADWYVDPFLELEIPVFSHCKQNPKSYVCTNEAIPSNCIKLFEYNMMKDEDVIIKKRNGVTHIYRTRLPLKMIIQNE